MIPDDLKKSKVLLRDYKPFGDNEVNIVQSALFGFSESERKNMELFVNDILDRYTLQDYLSARGGFDRVISNIDSVIDKSGVCFTNKRILEFGAGICKLSAVISRKFDVSEIWCLDQAERLLSEIAPRIIKIVGGDLSVFRFVIGDMNSAFDLNEKFDAIVCYGAVHHLHLPEYFFDSIHKIMNPGGVVLIVDEPTLPIINMIPGTQVARFKAAHFAVRRTGDNENAYTVGEYKNIFGGSWDIKVIHLTPYSRFMPYQPYFAFASNFLLRRPLRMEG